MTVASSQPYSAPALWSAQAHMPSVLGDQLCVVAGKGAYIELSDGRRMLDAGAGLWYANIGHGRETVARAAYEQMSRLETFHVFGRYVNDVALALAERLASVAPLTNSKVILTSGGSDAVDSAMKLARRHWQLEGRPGKRIVLSREYSYHGLHAFGTSIAGLDFNRTGYGGDALIPDTRRVSHDDIDAVRTTIHSVGGENIAAVIAEPVIGSGGVHPPPDGYFDSLQQLCAEHEILFVADEVITGFGRVGAMFASERLGLKPDMVVFAKGVTSGYAPLGGVLVGPRIWSKFYSGADAPVYRHGLTYSGHATCCAVAMANLDILEAEQLPTRVLSLEPILAAELEKLRPLRGVRDVRYFGLMGGVQLDGRINGNAVVAFAEAHGIALRLLPNDVLMISPPFVIDEADLVRVPHTIAAALRQLQATP